VLRLGIISDTHLPRGDRQLPARCRAELDGADLILHAGDIATLAVLRAVERYGAVVAVAGNVDDEEVRAVLPSERVVEAGGARIGLVHDAGPAKGRLARMRRRFGETDAVVFGHSHIPLLEADADGFQIFNPGSPTDRRRQPRRTMGLARVEAGRVAFELLALD